MSSVHNRPNLLALGQENGWFRRPSQTRQREQDRSLQNMRYYANEVKFVPGIVRTRDEIAKRAEELYGPAIFSNRF